MTAAFLAAAPAVDTEGPASVHGGPSTRPVISFPDTRRDDADRLCDMQRALRATGRLVSGDRLADRLRSHVDQAISRLARWIVDHRVVSFATPNACLDGASPAPAVADGPRAVVQAARADRFVAAGSAVAHTPEETA
jgi:hypothetical protein